jgi:hypothetical protein
MNMTAPAKIKIAIAAAQKSISQPFFRAAIWRSFGPGPRGGLWGQDRGLGAASRYRNLHDAHVQAELTINDRTEVPDSPAVVRHREGRW